MLSSSGHPGSHHQLIQPVQPGGARTSDVDAVIVPTRRPGVELASPLALARRYRCPLVVLHSGQAGVCQAYLAGDQRDVEFVGVDMSTPPFGVLPEFGSDKLLRKSVFARDSDLSAKRNIALLLAIRCGWRRIVFLDDDITIQRASDVDEAAALLDRCGVVGLGLDGFPDNSVVCHANRDTAGPQEMFVGGGAMLVDAERCTSFFPDIYNDDWFFLLPTVETTSIPVVGRAHQAGYDPYADVERARSEEFGDCLAEGLYAVLDRGGKISAVDQDYWEGFLRIRRQFIAAILDRTREHRSVASDRMRAALTAAMERSHEITAGDCDRYLTAWRDDVARWAEFVDEARADSGRPTDLATALLDLGLADRTTMSWGSSGSTSIVR
jgi:hypothetical protein